MDMLEATMITTASKSDQFNTYGYGRGLDYMAHRGEWQRLSDLCDKINDLKSAKQEQTQSFSRLSSSLLDYKLTALYKLGKREEFAKNLEALIKKHSSLPREIFDFLDENVADEATIGSLYIDFLSKKKDAESKTWAFKFCTHLLARNQGKDGYYKRLIALAPEKARDFIQSLREYDPFEERPLIWLSEMALAEGHLEKAYQLINQAIALDPSDGDHGKFSRMYCYDVLSRILAKQGDMEKAEFFQEVLKAIRDGEVADDYLYAGLIQEATERYQKALGHFNDAYCLQSRLAMTLMKAGKFDEAVSHFEKAFELMPVSFGPRESQCFGCEGLFNDERVQNIAIPALNAIMEKDKNNPRTPYLLGLVFEEMNKNREAITAYRKALELDPHYYNAARKLHALISVDPSNFKESQKVKKQLYDIASYKDKPRYIPNPHLLKSYWKLAQNYLQSPIKLSDLEDLGLKKKALSTKQYDDVDYRQYSYITYFYDEDSAVDGWSPREILLMNAFLSNRY